MTNPNHESAAQFLPGFMAPIFAPTIVRASPYPVLAAGATARIEPEIAFVMAPLTFAYGDIGAMWRP